LCPCHNLGARNQVGGEEFWGRTAFSAVCLEGRVSMKDFIYLSIFALAVTVTGPAFAGDVSTAATEAECTEAGGSWDADANTCSEKEM